MSIIHIWGSSNGRTTDFGSVYLGPTPSPQAMKKEGAKLVHLRGGRGP